MSTSCPYRHISYASWRYQTFQWLLADSRAPLKPSAVFSGNLPIHEHRRALSYSARRQADDYNSRKPGIVATNTSHLKRSDLAQTPNNKAERASHAADDGIYYIRRLDLSEICEHESELSEKDQKRRGRTVWKQRQWSPYDTKSKEDLRSLSRTMQETFESSESIIDDPEPTLEGKRFSDRLPRSPLTLKVDKEKVPKPRNKRDDGHELANNPWAKMLASPLRVCNATGVRMPRDLLTKWNLVRRPDNQDVYFMPAELAELDSLRDKRAQAKTSPTGRVELVTQESPPNMHSDSMASVSDTQSTHTDTDARVPAKPPKSAVSPVYMLPSRLLLHHISQQFTFFNDKTGMRESKIQTIHRIAPWRWSHGLERAKFYAERRRITSGMPKPGLVEKVAGPTPLVDLKKTKWSTEIDTVMLGILRERVLIALEALGRRNQKLWGKNKELVRAFRVSQNIGPVNSISGFKLLGAENDSLALASTEEGPESATASVCILIDPGHHGESDLRMFDPTDGTQATNKIDVPDRNSVLHQPAQIAVLDDDISESAPPFEPLTLHTGSTNGLPVFPLADLLDADSFARFQELSKLVPVLAPRASSAEDDNAYILLIPATAHGADVLTEEVWRLWRFLGGRMGMAGMDGVDAKSDEQDEDDIFTRELVGDEYPEELVSCR